MYISTNLGFVLVWLGLASCRRVHIQMPVSDVEHDDSYRCFVTPLKDYEGYSLVGYEIDSVRNVAHHAAVLACEGVNSDQIYWDCTSQQGRISKGRAVSLHGKDGAEIEHVRVDFPKDVGIELGPTAKVNYVVFQIHYKDALRVSPGEAPSANLTLLLTENRQKWTRQTMLLASEGYIPANTEGFSSELIFKWSGVTVEAETFNIHSHDLGTLVEGYIIKNGSVSLIGRHSPQQHGTSSYKMANGEVLRVSPGDVIAARCVYNNPQDKPVRFGTANSDEMCNFSLNFLYPTQSALTYPRTVLQFQDPLQVTWCNNDVYTSPQLCELSKIVTA